MGPDGQCLGVKGEREMESLEGLASAWGAARRGRIQMEQDIAKKTNINQTRNNLSLVRERDELAADTWYWGTSFRAASRVFAELAKRYPNDPLFKATGKRREDGQPELAYHILFEQLYHDEAKKMPSWVSRGKEFIAFLGRVRNRF